MEMIYMIIDEKMVLNERGEIAQQQWQWLINKYLYLKSHAFVVMPDHTYNYVFRLIYTSNALGATVYSPLFCLSYHM
ncbi:MAG TPA: hypothetical protein VJY12_10265 [Dysgonamonadaceae bacterium]|nr:hypothetical protein [Dysgonamonadaceae bacterium]